MIGPIAPFSRRRGTTLIEAIMAVTLLAAGLAMTGQVLYTTSRLRRDNERRGCALQEAANALEQLRAMPWSELAADEPPQLELSPAGARQLPGGKLALRIVDEPAETASPLTKRLEVDVSWRPLGGQASSTVSASSWRFSGEDQP
jgi:hypothetical protein